METQYDEKAYQAGYMAGYEAAVRKVMGMISAAIKEKEGSNERRVHSNRTARDCG